MTELRWDGFCESLLLALRWWVEKRRTRLLRIVGMSSLSLRKNSQKSKVFLPKRHQLIGLFTTVVMKNQREVRSGNLGCQYSENMRCFFSCNSRYRKLFNCPHGWHVHGQSELTRTNFEISQL